MPDAARIWRERAGAGTNDLFMSPPGAVLRALLLCSLGGCALIPEHADAPERRIRGPFPSRIQQPIALGRLGFRPRGTDTEPAGRASLALESAYANLFENGSGPGGQEVVTDGELWNNSLLVRYGISERADVEIDLSVLYGSGGFLDRFIEGWHRVFGFPNGGHEERPRFAYDMHVATGGHTIWSLDGYEPVLLDTPLVTVERLIDEGEHHPSLALRAGVDLPTGSEARGAGNGGWDWGVGFLAQKSIGRWTFTGAVDWVDAKRPSSFVGSGVQAFDGFDVQLGAEYRWNDSLSLLAGANLVPPVTRDFTIREIDREMLGLDLGFAWDTGESSQMHLGIEEDAISASGPDITFLLGWRTQL